jgi:general secretion pathway protein E
MLDSAGAVTLRGFAAGAAAGEPCEIGEALAALLVAEGYCDGRAIERGQRVASESGQSLVAVLVQLGLVGERNIAAAYAKLLDLPLVHSADYPQEPVLSERLKPRFLRGTRCLPLRTEGETLVVAVVDPLDGFTPVAIAAATGRAVSLSVAVPVELEAALDRLYAEHADEAAGSASGASSAGHDDDVEDDADRLKDLASEAPVIRLVNQIIARAVETRATDIHIEPFEGRLQVRYRYDGILHEADSPPSGMTAAIISRIKIMARLDIAERRLPQDGRIKLAVRGHDIDFRVSTIPSMHGETVALRILDRSATTFDYASLGLRRAVIDRLRNAFELPNGIVLVTGPTGSGKTTTLYTGLLGLNAVSRKIMTVEDPIEYQLAGIDQTQVKPQIGLSFATMLRAILRQDPDVIMVGEIRDLETAQIAVQAALTGHLVLSTLHTNSAAASVTRLRDMGLEDYLLTAVLRGVLAQRLVRRLCPACREEIVPSAELVERLELQRRQPSGAIRLWRPVGCPECRGNGYRGRHAIVEFLEPDETVARLILARRDHSEIERAAVAAGMATMFDAGIAAALEGATTVEEVLRSIRSDG